MNLDEILWIDRLRAPGSASGSADAARDPGAFQRVLQQAQDESAPAGTQVSATDQAAAEVSDFTAALQRAETQFTALMDLRRRLEAAFQSRMP